MDSNGNVYVRDFGNHTIRKITPAGLVRTAAGIAGSPGSEDGEAGVARFNGPTGTAVDSAGRVYVADTFNHTIRFGIPAAHLVSAFSHKMHGDASGDIDLPQIGPAGIECRTGGATGIHQVILHFARAVTFTSISVTPDPLQPMFATASASGYSVNGSQVAVDIHGSIQRPDDPYQTHQCKRWDLYEPERQCLDGRPSWRYYWEWLS